MKIKKKELTKLIKSYNSSNRLTEITSGMTDAASQETLANIMGGPCTLPDHEKIPPNAQRIARLLGVPHAICRFLAIMKGVPSDKINKRGSGAGGSPDVTEEIFIGDYIDSNKIKAKNAASILEGEAGGIINIVGELEATKDAADAIVEACNDDKPIKAIKLFIDFFGTTIKVNDKLNLKSKPLLKRVNSSKKEKDALCDIISAKFTSVNLKLIKQVKDEGVANAADYKAYIEGLQ
jgi:hypothetical protein